MINKKAQSLSITTVIIAAIAVVVLVVLIAILTGRLGLFTRALGTEGEAAKRTDILLYNCIPAESTYAAMSSNKPETLTAYKNAINTCKGKTQEACKDKCQWVG